VGCDVVGAGVGVVRGGTTGATLGGAVWVGVGLGVVFGVGLAVAFTLALGVGLAVTFGEGLSVAVAVGAAVDACACVATNASTDAGGATADDDGVVGTSVGLWVADGVGDAGVADAGAPPAGSALAELVDPLKPDQAIANTVNATTTTANATRPIVERLGHLVSYSLNTGTG